MKPFARTLAVAAAAALAACGSDITPLSVQSFHLVSIQSGLCSAGASVTQLTMDTARSTGMLLGVTVENDMPPNGNLADGRVDSHAAFIDFVEAKFSSWPAGKDVPPALKTPTSMRADPGGSANGVVTLLSVADGSSLKDKGGYTMVAEITLSGKLANGSAVRSIPRTFPIVLCDGCLLLDCETIDAETGAITVKPGWVRDSCGAEGLSSTGQACREIDAG